MRDFLAATGRWGIGSDSHISVSPVEELRWLEYGQRLLSRHRNIVADPASPSVGETLLRGVADSRASSTGFHDGDDEWLRLDADAAQFAGATDADIADRWIFAGNRPLLREVRVGADTPVVDGRHRDRDAIEARYRDAVPKLLAG
jgi:formimidoylglutamate deiminase